MAGTAKDFNVGEIVQGPGELWVLGTAPTDGAVRVTLASDGTPDATAHPASVHLGAIKSAITVGVKPKMGMINLDQFDAPFDSYVLDLEASIEAEMAQTESAKLQRMLGVATYSTAAGYKQVTFGGTLVVPKPCIACISPVRGFPNRYIVSCLYSAVAAGGFTVEMGRKKESTYKTKFLGLSDIARTVGQQMGVVFQTLADAAGGTPTAKNFDVTEIYQGPADLWLISAAPVDATPRVILDAATLTPDTGTHAACKHLGTTDAAVTLSVIPKIDEISADQFDGPLDVFIASLAAKIEAEMSQSSMEKLNRALAVGIYTLSGGAYAQTTFGGTNQAPKICIAAIGRKRTDTTKAVVACLFSVNSVGGITVMHSRNKKSMYKVTFEGLMDASRTAGKQIGVFHEMI